MKLSIKGLIQILNKNTYMMETHMDQLKYILKHDIIDYKQYVQFNNDHYQKNIVYQNHIFEIYIICWKPGQQSILHSHPKNGCLMKVLEGSLIEKRYGVHKETINRYCKGNISFIKNDTHIVKNDSIIKNLVTLHIYSPPNFYKKK